MVKLPDFLRGYALRPPSDWVLSKSLAANTAEGFAVPAGAFAVILSCTDNFYADTVTTAVVPGDVTNGTAPELNPVGFQVVKDDGKIITTISMISANACIITAAFYS